MASSIEARLRERDEARRAAIEQRRREKEAERREEETASYFTQQFTAKKTAIEELLLSSESLPREQLSSHFDLVSMEYHTLQKFVSDSALFLTSYDLRSSQQQISQLLQQVNTKQDQLLPRKKFAFRTRKKEGVAQPQEDSQTKDSGEKHANSTPSLPSVVNTFVGFREKENEKLSLSVEEVKGHDVNLAGLSFCEVRLYGPPSTLHMSRLQDCVVLCGPVSSSVFVEECSNCTFVVACQQLRVHKTQHTKFYLHVSSRAIIEDCTDVLFAPYNWSYPEINSHFEAAGLDQGSNNWDKVDDFNWLASSDPSPNWTVLPDHLRTASWN